VEVRLDDRAFERDAVCTLLGGGDPKLENTWAEPDRVSPRAGRVAPSERGIVLEVPAPGLAVLRAPTRAR
jgi:hypothetical protein